MFGVCFFLEGVLHRLVQGFFGSPAPFGVWGFGSHVPLREEGRG